jgi:hypothetical protein
MENNTPDFCKICGSKLSWKEGGTRADGSTYDGFMACPAWKQHPKDTKPQAPRQNFSQVRQDNIKEAVKEKRESIDTWASINNASLIVAESSKVGILDDKTILARVEILAKGLYAIAQEMKRASVFNNSTLETPKSYERSSQFDDVNQELGEINE